MQIHKKRLVIAVDFDTLSNIFPKILNKLKNKKLLSNLIQLKKKVKANFMDMQG